VTRTLHHTRTTSGLFAVSVLLSTYDVRNCAFEASINSIEGLSPISTSPITTLQPAGGERTIYLVALRRLIETHIRNNPQIYNNGTASTGDDREMVDDDPRID